jgi:multiple sugar transport system substrate-binding protein
VRARFVHSLTAMLLVTVVGMALPVAAKVEVEFWHTSTPGSPQYLAFTRIVDEFNRSHTSITVEHSLGAGTSSYNKWKVMIAANEGPDVVFLERSQSPIWGISGFIQPLRGAAIERVMQPRLFLPGPFGEVHARGQLWAVPLNTDLRGLYWNADQFGESGLNPDQAPRTVADLDQYAQKLTRTAADGTYERIGYVPWEGNWAFIPWVWAFGGSVWDEATQRVLGATPRNLEAMEWIDDYAVRYPRTVVDALVEGLSDWPLIAGGLSMLTHGDWAMPWLDETAPHLNYQVGPVPHMPNGRNGTYGGGFSIAVTSTAKSPEAAMEFVAFMASAWVQLEYANAHGVLPTNREAYAAYLRTRTDRQRIFYAQIDEANPRIPLVWNELFLRSEDLMAEVSYRRKSPREALEDLERIVQPVVNALLGK